MTKSVKYYKGELIECEVLKMVDFYDPILRKPTQKFKFEDTEECRKQASYIAFSLAETLTQLQGLGLSANQVGLPWSVCVVNMGKEIWTMFNPEIIYSSPAVLDKFQEGCLSYPGLYVKIPRPNKIKVRFQAIGGQFVEQEFDGLTAVCVHHEIDHLNGIMFTDLISPIKLDMAKRKVKQNLKKMKRFSIMHEKHKLVESQIQTIQEQIKPESFVSPKIDIKIVNEDRIKEKEDTKTLDKFVYSID